MCKQSLNLRAIKLTAVPRMEKEGSVIYFLPIAQPVKCLVMLCHVRVPLPVSPFHTVTLLLTPLGSTSVLSDVTTRSESCEDLYASQCISSGMAWNVRKGPKYSFFSLCHNIKPPLSQTIPLIQFVTGALSNEWNRGRFKMTSSLGWDWWRTHEAVCPVSLYPHKMKT